MRAGRGLLLLAVPALLVVAAVVVGFGKGSLATEPTVEIAAIVLPSEMPETQTQPEEIQMVPIRVPMPVEVRGIYWNAVTAAGARAEELIAYMVESGLNAVVIDVKLDNGSPAWPPDGLLPRLGDLGIYRIARISVMRDSAAALARPELALRTASGALWRDRTGAAWLDPAAPGVVALAIDAGREAYARGFDEVQFDYVRFPTDGALAAIRYPAYGGVEPKVAVMDRWFAEVGGAMRADGIPTSFDLFGMTFETANDFGIGQTLLGAYPHAVAVSPMVYPSHYASGFQGYANPALHPYEVVAHSLASGLALVAASTGEPPEAISSRFRPWIQDFDLGATYTAERIEAQIRAARDANAGGWLLWNARNVYEPADYLGVE